VVGRPCTELPCVDARVHRTVVGLAGYLTNSDADGRFEFELDTLLDGLEKAGAKRSNRRT
jgi:hypothetical protein